MGNVKPMWAGKKFEFNFHDEMAEKVDEKLYFSIKLLVN